MKNYIISIFKSENGEKSPFTLILSCGKADLRPRSVSFILEQLDERLGLGIKSLDKEKTTVVFRAVDFPNEAFDPRLLAFSAPGTYFNCRLVFYHKETRAMEYTPFYFQFLNPKPLNPIEI